MTQATILFADNDRDFLDTRSEFLEAEGYTVLKAYCLEEARDILDHRQVQLAILDIRLTDDADAGDISGLELAQEAAYNSLPKIMLTGFPNVEAVRIALRPVVNQLPPAVDYISKKGEKGRSGADVLIEAVKQAFDEHVRINWDLRIRWGRQGGLLPPVLVSLIYPDLARRQLADRAGELEDLFRRLFHGFSHATLGRILARRQGRILLTAFSYPAQGSEQRFVVSCGHGAKVETERDRYSSFVPQGVGEKSINLEEFVETIHFGAAAYRLGGCAVEEAMVLTEFYQQQPTARALAVIESLFTSSLRPWYERAQERRPQPMENFCREWLGADGDTLDQTALEKRVASLSRAALAAGIVGLNCLPHKLVLCSSEGGVEPSYPNPVPYLCEERIAANPPTLCGITHGRLDGESVLVDRTGQPWTVDFEMTGLGPLVRDFVSLETSVKFDMLVGAGLAQRHELESRLMAMGHLGEEIDVEGMSPEVEKALQVIVRIRSQGAGTIGPEMEPYLVGLLFCAVRRFLDYQPELRYAKGELVVFAHALLSAAMMCRRLVSWEDRLRDLPAQASESLWIDADNREVWVEGRRVTLSPLGFRLLQYFYDRPNQLCERLDIAKHVFDVDHSGLRSAEVELMEKDQINTNISRLRKAIEPNPSYPKYLVTVHGAGYKLVIGDMIKRTDK